MARTRPYTARGIRRLQCERAGCTNRATTQRQVCADGRVYRRLCTPSDVELNRMVLEWAGDPDAEEKVRRYAERLRG